MLIRSLLAASVLLGPRAGARDLGPQQYSAIMEVDVPGRPPMRERVFHGGQRQRSEALGPDGKRAGLIHLALLDRRQLFLLMPGGRCLEIPMRSAAVDVAASGKLPPGATVKELGGETRDGHPCRVELIRYRLGNGQVRRAKAWRARDLHGVPIRFETEMPGGARVVTRFTDIRLGPQPASLFVPPANCRATGPVH